MAVTVKIPTQLRSAAGGEAEAEVDGATVKDVLDGLYARHGELRERLSDGAARGAGGKGGAVYVDADEMHDAVRPAGTYTVKGTDVTVNVVLRKNNETVADLPSIQGTTNDRDGLADRIARAIADWLSKQ